MANKDKFTGERSIWMNPGDHLDEFIKVHTWYMEAMKHCIGKTVVDVGAGHGFGSFLLSLVAERVHSVDNEVLHSFSHHSTAKKMTWHHIDLEKERIDITSDICVAIELIEHLANPEFFLENLKSKELYFTVPCYGDKRNTFHKVEYNEDSLKKLIEEHYQPAEFTYKMRDGRMFGHAIKGIES